MDSRYGFAKPAIHVVLKVVTTLARLLVALVLICLGFALLWTTARWIIAGGPGLVLKVPLLCADVFITVVGMSQLPMALLGERAPKWIQILGSWPAALVALFVLFVTMGITGAAGAAAAGGPML